MQTFLPFDDFTSSVTSLDNKRLGKQRVEAFQIMRAISDPSYGWQHHPAVNMWRGDDHALILYGVTCCVAWMQRGYNDTMLDRFVEALPDGPAVVPPWIGNPEFHRSHQSNLIRKDPTYYGPKFPDVPDNLPYVWPVSP